ncbi:MAG: helix-turn-helix transcriptional regulator [Bacilli bacterium]|nr:helix-turn-helix transcriptional regulator [Bacilli bacterium]
MEFKDKLKKLREEKGLSQQRLADDIHVSRSAIAKWENGLGLPCKESIQVLIAYFGVEEKEFLPKEYENSIVDKNREIKRLRIGISLLVFIALITVAMLLFIDTPQEEEHPNHLIYESVPTLKVNDVEASYYKKAYEYLENENGDTVLQGYVVTYPLWVTYPLQEENEQITRITKSDNYQISVNVNAKISGSYYYLDEHYQLIESETLGWFEIKTRNLELLDNEFSIAEPDFAYTYIVLFINCEFEDLLVYYSYIIDTLS